MPPKYQDIRTSSFLPSTFHVRLDHEIYILLLLNPYAPTQNNRITRFPPFPQYPSSQTNPIKFAQELLSTFSTSLGEVALIPSTGGVFTVDIVHAADEVPSPEQQIRRQTTRLWDRKTAGGFPETKTLKKLIRDIIDPSRDLGHVDGHEKSIPTPSSTTATTTARAAPGSHKPRSASGLEGKGEPRDEEGQQGDDNGSVTMVHDAEAGVVREILTTDGERDTKEPEDATKEKRRGDGGGQGAGEACGDCQ